MHDQELTSLSSSLTELQQLLDSRNDREFTAAVDRRCRSLEGMGLCKPDKVTLNDVPSFKHGDDLVKWAEQLFNPILQHQGGAALQQWIHKENYVVNGLEPPPAILHVDVHNFTVRDTDTATLKVMLDHGQVHLLTPKTHPLTVGDNVELRVDLPTYIEDEFKKEMRCPPRKELVPRTQFRRARRQPTPMRA